MFKRKGAYACFRTFLREKDLTDSWYRFNEERTTAAMLAWCKENAIEIER